MFYVIKAPEVKRMKMMLRKKKYKFRDWTLEWWIYAFCHNGNVWLERCESAYPNRRSTKNFSLLKFIQGMKKVKGGDFLLHEKTKTE